MSRSFVDALKEKYCDDGDDNFGNIVVVFARPRKQSGSSDGDGGGAELGYLTNMVLCGNQISKAGIPPGGLASLCPNVIDLDLGSNAISCWKEVLSIFQHLPALKFVNLAGNPLGHSNQEHILTGTDQTFGINNLVLNNTKVTWEQATALACLLPKLKELHLCQNDYKQITTSTDRLCGSLPLLECLRLNENDINRWFDIAKLGSLPRLQTLILSDNPLLNIDPVTTRTESVQNEIRLSATGTSNCNAKDIGGGGGGSVAEARASRSTSDAVDRKEDQAEDGSSSEKSMDLSSPRRRIQDFAPPSCQEQTEETIIAHGAIDDENTAKEAVAVHEQNGVAMNDDLQQHNSAASATDGARSKEDFGKRSSPSTSSFSPSSSTSETMMPTFQALLTLCVSDTRLSSWSDLEALHGFPKLKSLKIRNVPLMQDASKEERRQMLVASLPKLSTLNGGEVTSPEREKSERHYVRYFSEEQDPPRRYQELVQKHGALKSLKVVDIGGKFTEYTKLSFIYGGRCIHQQKMHAADSIDTVRKLCAKLVKKNIMFLKVYYVAKNRDPDRQGPPPDADGSFHLEELFLDNLPISRYDMMDGDEIHIDEQKEMQGLCRVGRSNRTTIR